ncbi:MAG: aminoglycoside phosphotransferase family protein [Chloroflexi bacterium]|nr:aminoglycoside phosphotransferase family protein [Chloroflexota bacterium]
MADVRNLDWLRIVANARNANANDWDEDGVSVQRIGGGGNNAMYRVRLSANVRRTFEVRCTFALDDYACKLCVVDDRHRAQREFAALDLLQRANLDLAPQPIALDESCTLFEFPVVAYRWLEGSPLEPPLSKTQLHALLDSLQQLHTIRPADFLDVKLHDAYFHDFNFDFYIRELRKFFSDYARWLATSVPDGPQLAERQNRLIDTCAEKIAQSRVNPSRDHIAVRLSHVDPNLQNTVWQPGQPLRWVDWEFAGWGDPAMELADLRWHISLDELPESQHAWLRHNYRRPDNDPQFDERLAMWDCILVTRWCLLIMRLLWSAYNGPDRVRLTHFVVTPDEARRRLIRMIERAERFHQSN